MSQPDGTAPTDFRALEEALRARFDEFSPGQRRIAQRLLSDPEGCAFQTVTQLAESVEVDPSTVVRFATSLGLAGYPELSRLCQQRLRDQAQLVERFSTVSYLDEVEGDLLARVAAYDQANIARTFANIDPDDWKRACVALAEARLVQIVGFRKSYAPAGLLATLLGLVRDDVRHLTPGANPVPQELRRLGPGDALVACSIHRYLRSTVAATAFARRRGATTIVLTDNPASPLVPHADVVFYLEVAGAMILRSITAAVSLVQALANDVAVHLGTDTREALRVEEELLAQFDVYVTPEHDRARPPGPEVAR